MPRCPNCNEVGSGVIDIRDVDDSTRRRRVCKHCGHRFSTWEVQIRPVMLKRIRTIVDELYGGF